MKKCYICSRVLTETNECPEHHEYKGYCTNCVLTMQKEREENEKRKRGTRTPQNEQG
jgi:hypothetical protein